MLQAQAPYPASNRYIYGSSVQMWDINNVAPSTSTEFTSMNARYSFRFRSQHTGSLTGVRVYVMGTGYTHYGAGNGGTWRVTLRHDSTSNHTPAQLYMTSTDEVLWDYRSGGTTHFPLFTFDSPASIDSGTVYHVVFENIDADQATNWSSLNTMFTYPGLSPIQPFAVDADWTLLSSSTAPYTSWSVWTSNTPMMGYYFADGDIAGMGYYESQVNSPYTISGNNKIREHFTVTGRDRIVTAANFWMKRVSGTDALTMRLEQGDETLIEQGTIAAASIPTTVGGTQGGVWVNLTFASSHTLAVGQTYNLTLSTASGSSYSAYTISDGTSLYGNGVCFSDGAAQVTGDGSTWPTMAYSPEFMFYFNVVTGSDAGSTKPYSPFRKL